MLKTLEAGIIRSNGVMNMGNIDSAAEIIHEDLRVFQNSSGSWFPLHKSWMADGRHSGKTLVRKEALTELFLMKEHWK